MAKNVDQIVRTLLEQNNTQWAFHLSQKLYDTNFQTNTTDFQSQGNNCAVDISQP